MPSKNSLAAVKDQSVPKTVLPTSGALSELTKDQPEPRNKVEPKPKVNRINKGFQVEEGRARQWDILVAHLKSEGKTGPLLMDEAMDYVFKKYSSKILGN